MLECDYSIFVNQFLFCCFYAKLRKVQYFSHVSPVTYENNMATELPDFKQTDEFLDKVDEIGTLCLNRVFLNTVMILSSEI